MCAFMHYFIYLILRLCNAGRQVLTVADLRSWQSDTEKFMSSNPDLFAALQDPSRVFNMDETSV